MNSQAKSYNIYFDADADCVVMEWSGYSTTQEFREGTEVMLNTLLKNNSTKVLADIREMAIIGMEDQNWLQEDFLPRAIHFGFKAIAILRPAQYFNKVAVESVSYKVDSDKLRINFFDNLDEAKAWLHGA